MYDSAWWQGLRSAQLARQPLCQGCLDSGAVVPATHVDHIKPVADGGSFDDPANHQSLCQSCHSRKTAAADGGFGNRRR
ncbi:HNH endonuclease [Chitinimonas koreensis]|uniref:HNH endonuclease n=1 Tax=Chitinimonas koreensis TaxID=356302 RepID=UPI00146FC4D2|nr:HNH endonuclease signature motif containing protein [Chitinimonas koreensis]QNM94911.1 HNH endonuclease [Chitinimonas koreensis]